jgi:acyl-CoA reductase-like NAD-dependent aldehyde dehydrogenase
MAAVYVREIAAATSQMRGMVPQRDTATDGSGKEVDGLTVVLEQPVGVVLVIPP